MTFADKACQGAGDTVWTPFKRQPNRPRLSKRQRSANRKHELHGLEEAAGVRYEASDPARTKRGCPALVVYADDMVALCHSKVQAEQVKARMAEWRAARGLSFNEAKTRIVTIEDGFDFLSPPPGRRR